MAMAADGDEVKQPNVCLFPLVQEPHGSTAVHRMLAPVLDGSSLERLTSLTLQCHCHCMEVDWRHTLTL
jgi:hypothetical protein